MLDEIQAGLFDGWTYEDIEREMPEEFAARKKDKLKYRCPITRPSPELVKRPLCSGSLTWLPSVPPSY